MCGVTNPLGWIPLTGHRKELPVLRYALTHYLQLGSIRDEDWVAAQFGYR
jgi:hypothetical protein